ncbi:MAG: GIY-YIG nuclease family protein [Actinoplanes sp.]
MNVAKLPAGPGVYRFRDARGRALYIGRATHLRHRVGSYWSDLRGRRHLVRMIPQIAAIEAVGCDSVHEAAWLERNLLERSKPRWNRIRGGTEVTTCIRVEPAGLTVAYWPASAGNGETYGPYLGGTRSRLAVSALDRVLPLRYTHDRLDGCSRDLADVRGVVAADRDRFLATIAGVLSRQPAEVAWLRERLTELRDRASAGLAFELAARIQQELEAVDWVVAEQKVTRLAAGADGTAYGWADGLLVRFHLRAGRLSGWEQRTCTLPAARRHLDGTPDEWRAFAARAAELGRQLLS